MPLPAQETSQHFFVEAIRKAVGEVFSQSFASQWTVELAEPPAPSADGEQMCFGLAFSGSLQGNAAILTQQADGLKLAQKLRAEPEASSTELTDDRKQAVEKLFQQVAASAAGALHNQFGALEAQLAGIEAPAWTGVTLALHVSEASFGTLTIELRLDNTLSASLSSQNSTHAVPKAEDGNPLSAGAKNLDLLLGVGLSLTLRFGQRVLTLREI